MRKIRKDFQKRVLSRYEILRSKRVDIEMSKYLKKKESSLDRIFETPIGNISESMWNLIVHMFGYLNEDQWLDAISTNWDWEGEIKIEDFQSVINGIIERYDIETNPTLLKFLELDSWSDSYK